jgi:hypothetical protein
VGINWETLLNIDLEINNERQDYKIGIVCEGTYRSGVVVWRRLSWGNMVDGLHILYEIDQWNLLKFLEVGWRRGGGEEIVRAI